MTQATSGLSLDDRRVKAMFRGVRVAAEDVRSGWREFQQYMRVRTDLTFERLRSGGTFRGVTWKGFTPQYTRQDGTVVPAWGGVAKVRGDGLVLGRLRPSGQGLQQGDALMQDTGQMRKTAALPLRMTADELVMGPRGTIYAAAQNRMRRFLLFSVPRDITVLAKIMGRHIQHGARRRTEIARLGLPSAFSRIRR